MNNHYKATGFPAASDDFIEHRLNIHDYVVKNDISTFFMKVRGSSMKPMGVHNNDILVIDRSLKASSHDIVVVIHEGEFCIQQYRPDKVSLTFNMDDTTLWGVATYVIHKL